MSDLISRHRVLIALHESGLCYNNWLEVRDEINAVPSADRPTGKWVKEDEYGDFWVCDQCGFTSEHRDNFCPICGARMEVKEE